MMFSDPTGMDNCPNTDGRSPESRDKGGVGFGGDMSGGSGGDCAKDHSSLEQGTRAGNRTAVLMAAQNCLSGINYKLFQKYLDRFLDGYANAEDAPTAMMVGNFINNLGTAATLVDKNFVEDAVGTGQAIGAGWFTGTAILGGSAAATVAGGVFLGGYALNGASELGKITAGLGNMVNDAY